MDPGHRGWGPPPPSGTGSNPEQAQSQASRPAFGTGQQSPPQGPTALPPPPPTGPFPHFHQQPPSLAHLAGISQSSPRQPQPQTHRPEGGPQVALPGFSQATGQPGIAERERERERERAREVEQIHIKEEEDRRHREQQERQRLEHAPPHQVPPPPPMPLHQPVAVGPRSVHGPNGLLGNSGPQPQPSMPLGAPSGPGNIFAGGPVQPAGQQGQAPGSQQLQPGMLLPFAPGAQSQQAQQQQAQQAHGQGQGQQPILNDALSYLDQVKVQFADLPDVYNRFLDIMKDFKSGAIDTPGVIGRVSTLFAGNPDLIQGFNTFLPPGYRIECGADNDPNSIRVTTPMGTTVSSMAQPRPLSRHGHEGMLEGGRPANGTFTPQPGQSAQMVFSPSGRPVGPAAPGQQLPLGDAIRQQEQQAMHQQQERGVNSLQNAVSAATGNPSIQAGMSPRVTPMPGQQDPSGVADGQQGQMEKRGPVEFNHAISYVNKIKNRFSSHPDIYKQFLEILQTYQRESKPIQDVYSQVTQLFKTAPDLLEDFKQFLPESAAQAKAAERERQRAEESAMLSNVRSEGGGMYSSPVMSRETHIGTPSHQRGNLPPVGNFAPTPIGKGDNKRKRADRQTMGSVADGIAGASAAKAGAYGAQQGKRLKQTHPSAAIKGANDQPPVSPTLIPRLPEPLPPTTTSSATHEELSFFDRVKKAIGNKNSMNEFLKLCNLFSQDLVDRTTLIYRARAFIGSNPELIKWFMEFVGYDEKDIVIENKMRDPILTGRISLSNCRGLGPSYRLLPKRERIKQCSGRDELCNAVLNDVWASHPTWASEDSGFIAHRKNVHEEGLHRIEEERHDYDYNIEACSRTIQLMEPLAQSLRRMTGEEQVHYRLPPGLGGQSETIYKRVIMKLYGRDKGHEVITQLHDHPYQVIPVLLNRLKERLETWKLAQREWEKVWREQTQKMFWKSLDHQAVNARVNDRRQFQTKFLQGEIQVRYEEMKKEEVKMNHSLRGQPQMSNQVADEDVIVDASWLVLVYIEAQASTDSPRLAPFIREFIPLFFDIDTEVFERKLKERFGGSPAGARAMAMSEDPASGAEDSGGERRGRKMGKNTLLRQTLDKGAKGKMGRDDSASRASTPDVASAGEDAGGDSMIVDAPTPAPAEDITTSIETKAAPDAASRWFHHPVNENFLENKKVDPTEPQKRHVFRLWANAPVFCFVRMFTLLYERLSKIKASEAECRDIVRQAKKPKPAVELGIVDKLPSDFFGDTSASADYYSQMLRKFSAVLEGELDFINDGVEDCLRRFYLQAGYPLYPFEKIVQSLARFGGQVVINGEIGKGERSWEIIQAWRKDRAKDAVSAVQATDYRKQVEKLMGGGEGYALDWDQVTRMVKIFLVKKDDPYFSAQEESEYDRETKWRYYLASYSSIDATDGLPKDKIESSFLARNLSSLGADPKADVVPPPTTMEAADGDGERLLTRFLAAKNDEQLTLRIAVNNYHAIFQPGTAEGFFQEMKERDGDVEGAEKVREWREEGVRDIVGKNEGMEGLSSEDVEKRDEEWRGLTGEGEKMVE